MKSILVEYNHQLAPNRVPSLQTVTFQEGYSNGAHIADYTPYTAIISFPSQISPLDLAQRSSLIAHELAHHAVYSMTGDFRFGNNSVHYGANHDWTFSKVFRKGMLRRYKLVFFDVKRMIDNQSSIEANCRTEQGSPQPYWL